MVIIDKNYIAKVFVWALIEQGFSPTRTHISSGDAHSRTINFDGKAVFTLDIQVSSVSEVAPIVSVDSKSMSVDMIKLVTRVDKLLQKRVKIFLN